ncbi:hypothetical protein [Micromonospora aurantiaca (nom. illeg.)]|uniref:hypothetical protein n=1 Tax=Micromonospora aurantiaca (nom. illeg.) TaxID=47850 RepID=UPI0033E04F38
MYLRGVAEGWAEAQSDLVLITDWPVRQAAARPFRVATGRPVNPCDATPVRYGRNRLGHWGETRCAGDRSIVLHDGDRHGAEGRRGSGRSERGDPGVEDVHGVDGALELGNDLGLRPRFAAGVDHCGEWPEVAQLGDGGSLAPLAQPGRR